MSEKLNKALEILEDIRAEVLLTDSEIETLDEAITLIEAVYHASKTVKKPCLDMARWA